MGELYCPSGEPQLPVLPLALLIPPSHAYRILPSTRPSCPSQFAPIVAFRYVVLSHIQCGPSVVTHRGSVLTHDELAESGASLRGGCHVPMGTSRGVEVEPLMMDDESREGIEPYICQQVEDSSNEVHGQRTARLSEQEVSCSG